MYHWLGLHPKAEESKLLKSSLITLRLRSYLMQSLPRPFPHPLCYSISRSTQHNFILLKQLHQYLLPIRCSRQLMPRSSAYSKQQQLCVLFCSLVVWQDDWKSAWKTSAASLPPHYSIFTEPAIWWMRIIVQRLLKLWLNSIILRPRGKKCIWMLWLMNAGSLLGGLFNKMVVMPIKVCCC